MGRWVARAVRSRRFPRSAPPSAETRAERAGRDPFAAFPCTLGDVVVRRAERDEAWLAGALLFSEDTPVAALFVAPEAGGDRALFVREGTLEIAWMSRLAGDVPTVEREPPRAIEHEGVRFERARRLPIHVERCGAGTPAVGERAIVAEYAGPGAGRVVVVVGDEATVAWCGVALTEDAYEILPGGQSTLQVDD
jgi:hypothetical protein